MQGQTHSVEKARTWSAVLTGAATLMVIFQTWATNDEQLWTYLILAPTTISALAAVTTGVVWTRSIGIGVMTGAVLGFIAVWAFYAALIFAAVA